MDMENRNNDDELLLEQFFSEAREQTIDDGGFTERVMRCLPDRALRLSRLWTAFCLTVGVVLFVALKGWQPLIMSIYSQLPTAVTNLHPVPVFVTIGALSCLTLIELAYQSTEGRNVQPSGLQE